jgi:hypothetical protein
LPPPPPLDGHEGSAYIADDIVAEATAASVKGAVDEQVKDVVAEFKEVDNGTLGVSEAPPAGPAAVPDAPVADGVPVAEGVPVAAP